MLKIRLQRVGRKHDPSFRLIAVNSRNSAQGSYLEMLGSYDPRKNGKEIAALKEERIKHWLSVGAQVSDTAHNLLISQNIIDGKKRDVSSKKNVGKKEAERIAKEKENKEAENKNKNDTETKVNEEIKISEDSLGMNGVSEETLPKTNEDKSSETSRDNQTEVPTEKKE